MEYELLLNTGNIRVKQIDTFPWPNGALLKSTLIFLSWINTSHFSIFMVLHSPIL